MPPAHVHAHLLVSSRRDSEDQAEVMERGGDLVVVVADGAGGLRAGLAASGAIVNAVRSRVQDDTVDVHDATVWVNAFRQTDAGLASQMAGETTAVVIVLGKRGLLGVSAGDTEAWLVNAASIDDLTAEQRRLRLGSDRAVPVRFHRRGLAAEWLVVATDGLFKYATYETVAAAVRVGGDPSEVTQRLALVVQMPSGTYQDDVGIVVVRCG